ncbi:CBS domain-containing protein [Egibacter rhizosphaerae]|nr:CBS domain-containing protein [Egibacter rhizosphaerae]
MARDTRISDVMTTDVLTLRPEMPLEDAFGLLAEQGVSGAPVVDTELRLLGLLDDSNLLTSHARLHAPTTIELLGAYIPLPGEVSRYTEELRRVLAQTVGEAMTEDPPSLTPEDTVEDAATMLVRHDLSRVPIVEGETLVGLVSRGDLVIALGRAGEDTAL